MFKHILGMAAAASLGVGIPLDHHMGRTRYPKGHRPDRSRYRLPHQGAREIARRLRQAERNKQRQLARAEGRKDRFGNEDIARLSTRHRPIKAD